MPLRSAESRGNSDLKFYRLPSEKTNPRGRQLWIKLIRNENLRVDSKWTSVCSLHFKNGIKTYDVTIPSIFPWSDEWPKVLSGYNSRNDTERSTARKLKVVAPPTYGKKRKTDADGTTPRERRMKARELEKEVRCSTALQGQCGKYTGYSLE